MTLTEFLTARLAEDEAAAKLAAREGGTWTQTDPVRECGRIESLGGIVTYNEGSTDEYQAAHIARQDPARVLRDVEAKRRILADYEGTTAITGRDDEYAAGLEVALRALASVWSDHPDYDPAWA